MSLRHPKPRKTCKVTKAHHPRNPCLPLTNIFMTEQTKVSHLRNFLQGHISRETLLRLLPTVDFDWLSKNQKTVFNLYENYTNKQYEEAKRIFDIK
jgi:hypothetical protein